MTRKERRVLEPRHLLPTAIERRDSCHLPCPWYLTLVTLPFQLETWRRSLLLFYVNCIKPRLPSFSTNRPLQVDNLGYLDRMRAI